MVAAWTCYRCIPSRGFPHGEIGGRQGKRSMNVGISWLQILLSLPCWLHWHIHFIVVERCLVPYNVSYWPVTLLVDIMVPIYHQENVKRERPGALFRHEAQQIEVYLYFPRADMKYEHSIEIPSMYNCSSKLASAVWWRTALRTTSRTSPGTTWWLWASLPVEPKTLILKICQ